MRNLANHLTGIRFLLVILLYPIAWSGNRAGFLLLFVLAGITDVVDGFVARSRKETSAFGAKLDSLADYALYASTVVWLIWLAPEVFAERTALGILGTCIIAYGFMKLILGKPFRHLHADKFAAFGLYAFVILTIGVEFYPLALYILVALVGFAVLTEFRRSP